MVRLTKIFDLLGMNTEISLFFEDRLAYMGTCGECPRETWCCAYAEHLSYNEHTGRYLIDIIYR